MPISLGSTDKRYEPSELRFYFTLAIDAIGQLIVIPAKALIPETAQHNEAKKEKREKIVVIGTGRMGRAFATAFAERTSHTVSRPRRACVVEGFLIECETSIATGLVAAPVLVTGHSVDSGVEPG